MLPVAITITIIIRLLSRIRIITVIIAIRC